MHRMELIVDRDRKDLDSWENRIRSIVGDKFVDIFLTSLYRAAGWFVWGLFALLITLLAAWLLDPSLLELSLGLLATEDATRVHD